MRADSTIRGLGERFLGEIILLLPDLSVEQSELLSRAVQEAFVDAAVRNDVMRVMSDSVTPELPADLLERNRSGAFAEMRRLLDGYQPPRALSDFVTTMGTPPRERLQLMVELAEAQGAATLELILEDAVAASAHALVTQLGARVDPLPRLSDEQFDAAYRERTLRLGIANLHRLEPVPDELVRRVISDLGTEAGRWYVNAFPAALRAAVLSGAGRVAELTVVVAEPPPAPVDNGRICGGDFCGFVVDWEGPEPTAFNLSFGAPGALGARVLENLTGAGYRLAGRNLAEGLTIRLRPRLTLARCEFMSGTDNTACVAIDDVRVEFMGKYRDLESPTDFVVRNRCGADLLLGVDNFGMLVAMRINHAVTTFPGDDRPQPRC